MEDNAMPKRILKGRLYSKRRKGRARMRWLDDVESDLKKMEVKGWKERMRDREQWRLVVEEAKTHPGLYCRVTGNERACNKKIRKIYKKYWLKTEGKRPCE
jgi:hypothetical protein